MPLQVEVSLAASRKRCWFTRLEHSRVRLRELPAWGMRGGGGHSDAPSTLLALQVQKQERRRKPTKGWFLFQTQGALGLFRLAPTTTHTARWDLLPLGPTATDGDSRVAADENFLRSDRSHDQMNCGGRSREGQRVVI